MKVGIISRGSPDYSIDIVTDGLLRMFRRSDISIEYSTNFGPGTNPAYRFLYLSMQGREPFDIHDADVLIASGRSVEAAQRWKARTGRDKIAIVDGEDSILLSAAGVELAQVYFKREYIMGTDLGPKVRPLPFAAIPEEMPPEGARSGVYYNGVITHHFRKEIDAALRSMGIPEPPHVDKADYNRNLKEAQIGVAVRGNGWDTYRYWEIPYFGAALLAQKTGHIIPEDFKNGEEAVFYSTAEEFQEKLQWMMDHPAEVSKIAAAGHQAVMSRHLSVHRARTVLESVA